MFSTKLNYESSLCVDTVKVSGVNSIDISYLNETSIIKPLGSYRGFNVHNADSKKNISISRDFLLTKTYNTDTYTDKFLKYTGDISMKGSINYENSSYSFQSGYMTDYSANFAVGAMPRVTTNFTVYDPMVSGSIVAGSESSDSVYIPTQGSISITCDNSSYNRVIGFDYAIKSNRKAIYSIGSTAPSIVYLIPPLEYVATVQMEVDTAFMENSQNFLNRKENKTIYLNIGPETRFSVPRASLISEQLSASADGVLKLTLNYIGHS